MTTVLNDEPIQVTMEVVDVLEQLGINYVIGGSLASALHGVARATMDSDIIAAFREEHVAPFVAALKSTFYVDEEMIRDAIRAHRSFNVIHLQSLFKVDIFVAKEREFDRLQIARRSAYLLSAERNQSAYVASAEDTILAKLEWYRMGGEVSDRQWKDILGVIKVQADKLDREYLMHGADLLKVTDLLERALNAAR
ncbi:MAG: hypothetical protein A2Z03_10940 [Chloroflexi bacterium RBG_16_56_8]|nr:MAG: hypothetical protein A2Z03_10940 [Chloroflexi bacterium RBG_16_56_8]